MIRHLGLVFFLTTIVTQCFAQNGHIKYAVKIVSEHPMAKLLSVGTEVEIAFKPTHTRLEASTAAQSNFVRVTVSHKSGVGVVLAKTINDKKAMRVSNKEKNELLKNFDQLTRNPIKKVATEKVIKGYTCQKVLIRDAVSKTDYIVYVTPEIKPTADPFLKQLYDYLGGMPLKVLVRNKEATIQLTASMVSIKEPAAKLFKLSIPSDFKLVTVEDLKRTAAIR